MKALLFILTLFPFKIDFKLQPSPWDKILSKHYSLAYSDETRRFLPFDSVGKLVTQTGMINRNENYLVSKSDSDIELIFNIVISFYNDYSDSFSIKFIY
jgi:hypothetical protein